MDQPTWHSIIKNKGTLSDQRPWQMVGGKRCGCKEPSAFSTSTVPIDLKRLTLPKQNVRETSVGSDYHLLLLSGTTQRTSTNQPNTIIGTFRGGQVCLDFPIAMQSLQARGLLDLGTSWGALRDTGSPSPWKTCLLAQPPRILSSLQHRHSLNLELSLTVPPRPEGVWTVSDSAGALHTWGPFYLSRFRTFHLQRSVLWNQACGLGTSWSLWWSVLSQTVPECTPAISALTTSYQVRSSLVTLYKITLSPRPLSPFHILFVSLAFSPSVTLCVDSFICWHISCPART